MDFHSTPVRVYYRDTDAGGVVYHTRYAEFFEIGRTEMLRDWGLSAAELDRRFGILCPVVELTLKFRRSARYDDLLAVRTRLKEFTSVRLFFESQVVNAQGEVMAEGGTVNCGVDRATLRPVRLPDELVDLLKGKAG